MTLETMSAVERSLRLRQVPLFESLPDDRLAIFAEEARVRRVKKGEELLSEGMPIDAIYVIVDGEIGVSRQGVFLHRAGRPDSLGVLDALAGRAAVTARAATSAVTLEIGIEAVRGILEDNFDVVIHAFEAIGRLMIKSRKGLGPDAGYPKPRAALRAAMSPPLGVVQRTLLLRTTLNFGRGSIEALADLARHAREVRFAEGDLLWSAGARADHLVVLVKGSVHASAPGQSFRFGPGDTAGLMDGLGAAPRWYSAGAAEPTIGLRVDLEELYDVLEDDFELTLDCLGAFATEAVRLLDEGLRTSASEEPPRSLPMPRLPRPERSSA